jgi:RNA recognition motif-containing protein
MAKRLYVGNLPFSVTSEDLQRLFETYGTVRSAEVLSDRQTGRSRGFGFVEMENEADAEAAIASLDGNDHEGRRLNVNESRPRTEGGGPRGGRGYGGGRGDHGGY